MMDKINRDSPTINFARNFITNFNHLFMPLQSIHKGGMAMISRCEQSLKEKVWLFILQLF